MCTIVTTSTEEIQSLGALRAHWPVEPDDLFDDSYSDVDCLCGVDVEAVLHRAGVAYEWDPFGYRVIDV